MKNNTAINIAVGCVMTSGLEKKEKQLVITTLRNIEDRYIDKNLKPSIEELKLNDFKEYIQKELADIKLIDNTSDYFDSYDEVTFSKVSRINQLQLIMDEIRKFENESD